MTSTSKRTLDQLNKLYTEAEEVDRELFAEQRSNLLLIAGEHYSKVNKSVASNIRTSNAKNVSEQKLRLTKNHMHKVHRSYKTAILAEAPSTAISPKNATEMQDQKDAEMNQSVWIDVKHRHKLDAKTEAWVDQFVGIGEVCVKVFWDAMAGEFLGYEPKSDETGAPVLEDVLDEESGQPRMEQVVDELGNTVVRPVQEPVIDETKPIFKGDFVFEDVYGFNLMREAGTTHMDEKDRAWIVRKMVDTEELKRRYAHDEDIVSKIQEGARETFVVFDANKGGYSKRQGETLVRELYWDKCNEFPEGWFSFSTPQVIMEEGPLPGGVFPLVWEGFDKHPSTPRGRSIIKVARPWQAEINRASSQMAVAQITLGDDKILYQAGTKLAQGALLPGVRGVAYQGKEPTVLPGRTGAQYLEYVQANVVEMYAALMIEENDNPDKSGNTDPFDMLYRAASRKRRYSPYATKFERFQVCVTEKVLEVAKLWMPDDMLVYATGRREQVNVPEFRKTSKLCYQIKVEPRSDALETQVGKQLTFQHLIQYVGKQMDPKTIGKLAKQLPFGNYEEAFDDLTIDEDIAKNDMLALERGEPVTPTEHIEPVYMIKKLTSRIKKPDFRFLPPPVQQGYQGLKTQYQQIEAERQEKLAAAKNEYIPVDGTLVTVDVYVPDPKNPENQAKRLKLPQRAIEWLSKQLEMQGANQDKLEELNSQALAELADMMMSQRAGGQGSVGRNPGQAVTPPLAG